MYVNILENDKMEFYYFALPGAVENSYTIVSGFTYTAPEIAQFILFLMGYVVNRLSK